ncbi:MAG: acyl--CoA ligase [Solirubrobacterales bacterium]|nr:acyl--CoA ligase [Solirubrobacterales bacterium]
MDLNYTVFDLLTRRVHSPQRDEAALVYKGEARTYRELHDRSLITAGALAAEGVGHGTRVAVLMSNRHEWPEVFFGLAALGAICVPVNVLLRGPEVRHVVDDSDVSLLIADHAAERALSELDQMPPKVMTVGEVTVPEGCNAVALEDASAGIEPVLPDPGPAPTDTFIHYYTSGTTGLPKAAVHTHDGVLWNSFTQIGDFNLTDRDVYLCVPSLSWAAGFHDVVLALIMIGGRSVLMPTGETGVDNIVKTAVEQDVTHTFLVPTLLKQLSISPELLEQMRASKVRWIVTGSEPVPKAIIETLQKELPDCGVLQGYGLSEFPTMATMLRPEEGITHVGKAGRPLTITTMAIRTMEGEIVEHGEGEIILRSPATMKGYLNRPDANEETLRDGWLHTGDLGIIDEDGYLTVTGRKKDMIISGGLNIYPREIEDVIHRVESVREVAVVGVEDEKWGEAAVAVIVAEQVEAVDTGEIDTLCRTHLATFKCPRAIYVRTEPLPRNPSGKLLKRDIRPWAAERHRAAAAL